MRRYCTCGGFTINKNATAGTDEMKNHLKSYFAAWNEPDEAKRAAHLESAWAESGIYTDPTAYVEGRAGLVKHIGGFLGSPQFKGFHITPTSGADFHHDKARFSWKMTNAEGATVTEGVDFVEFDKDGRIMKIVGFFGPLPALEQ